MRILKMMTDCLLVMLLLIVTAVAAPQIFGMHVYTVLSPSMMPEIPVGSAVYVREEPFERIRVGDVVTYRSGAGNVYVTHRVVEKDEAEQALVTKGDANETPDGRWVHKAELMGVVRFFVPYLGYAATLFGGIGEKLLLAGLLLWLLLIKMIVTNVLNIREKGVTMR